MEWMGAKRNFGHVVLSVVLYHTYTRLFPHDTDLVPWATAIGFTLLSWQIVLWTCVGLFYWLGTLWNTIPLTLVSDTHPEFAHKYGFVKLPPPPGHTEPSWRTQTIISVRNMIFAFFLVPFLAYVVNQGPPQAVRFNFNHKRRCLALLCRILATPLKVYESNLMPTGLLQNWFRAF